MSQAGANSNNGSGANVVETLTGNSGGPVGSDAAFNIDVLGNNTTGIDIVGTPASNLLTVIGLAASTTQIGTVELATDAETISYLSTTLAITPSNLTAAFASPEPIGSTTPNTGSFTQVDVDNLRLDGNTLSSTDLNGNVSLEPNGSGAVVVPNNNVYVGSASPSNPYNIAVEDGVAGAIGISVQNTTVNTSAASNYQSITEPLGGDAYTLYNINGAATFSSGIDNSDSDQFKITTGSSPSGGTTAINITSGGIVSLPAGALDVPSGGTGAVTLTDHGILLGSGTSAVTALGSATNGQLPIGSTGADPVLASLTGGTGITITDGAGSITIDADNTGDVAGPGSSTDKALARWNGVGGDTLQDSTVIVTDNGEMTNASQPAFLAYLGSTDSNATGDGTVYTLGGVTALTEAFDQNGDFNTNGTFEAPVTGRYFLRSQYFVTGVTTLTGRNTSIITSNRTYSTFALQSGTSANVVNASLCDMDAGDTATTTITLTDSGGKVDDIVGSGTVLTFFTGSLIC